MHHPSFAEALRCHQNGQRMQAERLYQQILAHEPEHIDARHCLGILFLQNQAYPQAIATLEDVVARCPQYAAAWNNLGEAFRSMQNPQRAIACYQESLRLDAQQADAAVNLGSVLREECAAEQIVEYLRQVVARFPQRADAYVNLSAAELELDQPQLALATTTQGLKFAPEHAELHVHHAQALLALGQDVEGWAEYEWRLLSQKGALPGTLAPLWQGEELVGRTVRVRPEQGLGDQLQFLRFLPHLQQRGARLVLEYAPRMLPWVAQFAASEDVCVAEGAALPACDYELPIMSLGTRLQLSPDLYGRVPYLKAEPESVKIWANRLPKGPCVGLCLSGSPAHKMNSRRSIPIESFAPLFSKSIEHPHFVVLQKEAQDFAQTPAVLFPDLDSCGDAFVDTAALMMNLDLIITVDTSIAHLAGALGRPTWLLLSRPCDFRWHAEGANTLWYPSVRIFRQKTRGDWSSVLAEVTQALQSRYTCSIS